MSAHRKHSEFLVRWLSQAPCDVSIAKAQFTSSTDKSGLRRGRVVRRYYLVLDMGIGRTLYFDHGECDLPTRRHAEASCPKLLHPNRVQGRTLSSVAIVSNSKFAQPATAISIIGAAAALLLSRGAARDRSFGQRLFRDKANCQFCHDIDGDGRGSAQLGNDIPHDPHSTSLTRREIEAVTDYILTTFVGK